MNNKNDKPSGEWMLVPREATPEMWEAGMNCHSPDDTQGDYLEKAWGAMLAAAPKPESAEAVELWVCDSCGYHFQDRDSACGCRREFRRVTLYTAPPRPEASALSRSLKLEAAEEQAEAWQEVCALLSELRPGWAVGRGTGQELALATIRRALIGTAPQQASAPVGVEGPARRLLEAYDDNAHPFEAAAAAEELRNALAQQPAAIPRLANCGKYTATDNSGQHYYLNHANTWQTFQGQQPAAVDEAMVERVTNAVVGWATLPGDLPAEPEKVAELREVISTALVGQQQGGTPE